MRMTRVHRLIFVFFRALISSLIAVVMIKYCADIFQGFSKPQKCRHRLVKYLAIINIRCSYNLLHSLSLVPTPIDDVPSQHISNWCCDIPHHHPVTISNCCCDDIPLLVRYAPHETWKGGVTSHVKDDVKTAAGAISFASSKYSPLASFNPSLTACPAGLPSRPRPANLSKV